MRIVLDGNIQDAVEGVLCIYNNDTSRKGIIFKFKYPNKESLCVAFIFNNKIEKVFSSNNSYIKRMDTMLDMKIFFEKNNLENFSATFSNYYGTDEFDKTHIDTLIEQGYNINKKNILAYKLVSLNENEINNYMLFFTERQPKTREYTMQIGGIRFKQDESNYLVFDSSSQSVVLL